MAEGADQIIVTTDASLDGDGTTESPFPLHQLTPMEASMDQELYVERGALRVENGTVEVKALLRYGEVRLTAEADEDDDEAELYLTVDQAMTLGNKLTEAAGAVRRATPIGAKGNE